MAITRLLVRRTGVPHFRNRGLILSTKSCSSSFSGGGSEKSSFLKGSMAAKESTKFDEKPKRKTGSWLKGMLTNIKQKMLGAPEAEKPFAREASVSKADMTASEMAQDAPQGTTFLASQSVHGSPEVGMNSPGCTEGVSSCSTSHTIEENAFEGAAVTVTSQVGKMINNPDNSGVCDNQNIAQSLEAMMAYHGEEKDKLRTLASKAVVKNSSLKMDQPRKLSDIFVEKLKNEVKQLGEAKSDVLVDCGKEQSPCAENLIGLTELISEKPKTVSEGTIDLSPVEIMKHKEQSPSAEDRLSLTDLISEKPKTLSEGKINISSVGDMNQLHGKRSATFVQRPYAGTNSSKKHKLSRSMGAQDLENILKRTKNNATTGEIAVKVHETLAPTGFSEGKKVEENQQFSDLIKSIMTLPADQSTIKSREITISNVTDQLSNEGFLKDVQKQANLWNPDVKRRQTSLKQHPMCSESKMPLDKNEESNIPRESIIEQEEESMLSFAGSDNVKPESNYHRPLSIGRKVLESGSPTCLTEEGSEENKVLVRFIAKYVDKDQILEAFGDCGPIVDVEVITTKGSIFKDFLVHFETRKGYQTALKKTDRVHLNKEAFVEATSSEDMDDMISIPDLIGDPGAPVALVKNPTKTVKVTELSEDISSQHLKKALTFCQSGISSFFLGSTSSVVYVEFETEDAKERALARHSIHVSGKELPILRIDAPRTTVVRISNIKPESKIWAICNSHGQAKHLITRAVGVVDVHFKLAEWPNMLNIINALNGLEVDNSRWLAQPAPVFPPRVLQALWSQPEERRHVNTVMCNLLREIEKRIDTTELSQLTNLLAKYHGKGF